MRFTKMHGIGNDYVYVNCFQERLPAEPAIVAQAVSDRHFGIGSDGLILIGPSEIADARMRMFNADGSEAEMCGNGLRCVAKHLWEASASASATLPNTRMVIDTGAGPLACVVAVDRGAVTSVEIDMGRPRLTRTEIPMTGPDDERCVDQPITIPGDTGGERRVTCVSMGNPHAVVFVDDAAAPMALATTIGPALERHAWFPKKTNAEFAHVASRTEIDLVVWERGAGLTLACGTGACATAVAACLTGRADPGTAITVRLPGGPLTITVAQDYSTVTMRGPARRVFEADLDLAKLPDAARPT
jgi:diaminopimelate epimerase